MPRFVFALAALALLLAGLALALALRTGPAEGAAATYEGEGGDELAYHMAYLQRYAEKLHAAGSAANWPLAGFYVHELEETGEAVEAGGYVEAGQALAPLVPAHLGAALEEVEAAVAVGSAAAFEAAYGTLVAGCNDCHVATEHGFIRIVVPEGRSYLSQDFAP